jgi:hypothetical protein
VGCKFAAHLRRGGGHDVEVSRIRRKKVAGTLHFDEHRDPRRLLPRLRSIELRLGDEAIPRNIRLDVGDDVDNRFGDRVGVGI